MGQPLPGRYRVNPASATRRSRAGDQRNPRPRAAPGLRPGALGPPARSWLTMLSLRAPSEARPGRRSRRRMERRGAQHPSPKGVHAPQSVSLSGRRAALHPLVCEGIGKGGPAPGPHKKQGRRSFGCRGRHPESVFESLRVRLRFLSLPPRSGGEGRPPKLQRRRAGWGAQMTLVPLAIVPPPLTPPHHAQGRAGGGETRRPSLAFNPLIRLALREPRLYKPDPSLTRTFGLRPRQWAVSPSGGPDLSLKSKRKQALTTVRGGSTGEDYGAS